MADRKAGEICHTCGGTGFSEVIAICDKCKKISAHVHCMKILPDEFPEHWDCEECTDNEQAFSDPKGKQKNFAKTGKVNFIPERERAFFGDQKYFPVKSSETQGKAAKLRSMTDILGSPHHETKKEVMTRDMVKGANQRNREHMPEKKELTNLPISEVAWKGVIGYLEFANHTYNVQAHLAEKVSQKVQEISKKMARKIFLKVKVKSLSQYWPEAFRLEPPSDDDIALYFFSESERQKEKFDRMVERLYKSNQVLVGQIGFLRLVLFSSLILPKDIQCIKGQLYVWGILQKKRKMSNQKVSPATVCATNRGKSEIHGKPSGPFQVKSNEIVEDMEIDMIDGMELSTLPTAKCASQPDPRIPPGFHVGNFRSKKPISHSSFESDMARLMTSPRSQLHSSE